MLKAGKLGLKAANLSSALAIVNNISDAPSRLAKKISQTGGAAVKGAVRGTAKFISKYGDNLGEWVIENGKKFIKFTVNKDIDANPSKWRKVASEYDVDFNEVGGKGIAKGVLEIWENCSISSNGRASQNCKKALKAVLHGAGKITYVDEFVQSASSISQKITKSFEEIEQIADAGKRMSTKTAKKLSNDGVEITDLDNVISSDKVKTYNNGSPTAGDRDLATSTHLIECKTTLSNRSFTDIKNQIDKMVEVSGTEKGPLRQFINPTNKKVIIYTEESLSGVSTNSLNQIKAYAGQHGVLIIDSYNDLLNALK